ATSHPNEELRMARPVSTRLAIRVLCIMQPKGESSELRIPPPLFRLHLRPNVLWPCLRLHGLCHFPVFADRKQPIMLGNYRGDVAWFVHITSLRNDIGNVARVRRLLQFVDFCRTSPTEAHAKVDEP